MGSKHLSQRENWQKGARITGDAGENTFVKKVAPHLSEHYVVELKPKKMEIYSNKKGVVLDAKITNTKNGKVLFFEVKSGENGGNVHERVYKFTNRGIKEAIRNIYPSALENPVAFIFSGKTFSASEPYYVYDKEGKRHRVNPQKYRDEFEVLLKHEAYFVTDSDYTNITDIAKRIMEIL
jgi:hypothetical protein